MPVCSISMCVTSGPDGSAGGEGGALNCAMERVMVERPTSLRVAQPTPWMMRAGSTGVDWDLFWRGEVSFVQFHSVFWCFSRGCCCWGLDVGYEKGFEGGRTMTHFPLRSPIVLERGAAIVTVVFVMWDDDGG